MLYCVKCHSKRFIDFKTCYILLLPFNTTIKTVCFARNFCISYQQACTLRTGTKSLKPCIP